MGERKGQNKYYPPDFDYKKHKSLDNYHGSHPLRERAKKLDKGILIIRFEMPYNIWCGGCNSHIGMGVRYNAEKSKIGNYYTTPIYKFRMKCHLCTNHFEIKTDPAAHDYVIIQGARRKEQRWDPKENEQIVPEDRDTHKKLERDAMYKLEHGADDKSKIKAAIPGIKQIEIHKKAWKDDYGLNKIARAKFRGEKKSMKAATDADTDLLRKSSLNIDLVEEHTDDVKMAQLLKYRSLKSFDEKQKQKRDQIQNQSIFSSMGSPVAGAKDTDSTENTSTPSSRNITPVQAVRERLGLSIANPKKPSPFASSTLVASIKSINRTDLVNTGKGNINLSNSTSSNNSSTEGTDEQNTSANKSLSIVAGYGSSSDSEGQDFT